MTGIPLRVSVVIPTYRRPEMVARAVQSVLEQDLDKESYEVIVVDTSPDDETEGVVTALQKNGPYALRLIRKEKAEGPGPSRHAGAMAARGEFVAFMDSDCQAEAGWLRAGLAAFEDDIGLVSGRVVPDPDVATGVFKDWLEVEAETAFYPGANVFFRRSCVEQAGELPHDLTPCLERPTGGEDTLLAWRVKQAGWRSCFAPGAVVRHEVKPISPWFWLVTRHRRMIVMAALVRHIPELRHSFFLRYFYDAPQAALLAGLTGTVAAVMLTPFAFLAWVPYVLVRAGQRTAALSGPKRLLRPLFYVPVDLVSLGYLVIGSVRARRVVL